MSAKSAQNQIKRQAKILKNWGPWEIKLNTARDLVSIAWGFDNWNHVVQLSKSANGPADLRFEILSKKTLDDEQLAILTDRVMELSYILQDTWPLAARIHREGAKMLVNAFLGKEKPHPVLAKTESGDWIFHLPACWTTHNDVLFSAYDTQDNQFIRQACLKVVDEVPEHLEALTQLAYEDLDQGELDSAVKWSTKAFKVCHSAMGEDFDQFTEEVSWGFISNRPFHRALYVHANVLHKLKKDTEAKEILKALLFMNPRDNMGVREHTLISRSIIKKAEKRELEYEQRELQRLAEMNGVSVEEMVQLREQAERQLNGF